MIKAPARKLASLIFGLAAALFFTSLIAADEPPLSNETKACIGCHRTATPGIYFDWKDSGHARTTPAQASGKDELSRMVSGLPADSPRNGVAVGCFECHGLNPELHKDNFSHNGFNVNVVVSPNDCKTCHREEALQYDESKKSFAVTNLTGNPVYINLVQTVLGIKEADGAELKTLPMKEVTKGETCFACHGTKVEVTGVKTRETSMGAMTFPVLSNWPNQGVGRLNPDGSKGSCASCHPRHGFSIEVARKPYTCAECHLEPDTPAWNVYAESKHGNIFMSTGERWNWTAVPWKAGVDFKAPTCATCHVSLIADENGEVIARRNHNFGSRLWTRLFGLIYAVPQPKSGDTTIIRNKDGLPMPVTFLGEPAESFLITAEERDKRKSGMKAVCGSCHGGTWVDGHFAQLEATIEDTNTLTLTATKLLSQAWEKKIADPANPFDEDIEMEWVEQWLFHANSTRYASAMGGQDYAAFKHGWWEMSKNLVEMKEKFEER